MQKLSHDIFLLMLNLSQFSSQSRILELFLEAINNWLELDITLRLLPAGEESTGLVVPITTLHNNFGQIAIEGALDRLPDDEVALLRNAVRMLAVILENREQARLLAEQNQRLESVVRERTAELLAANTQLVAEIEERRQAEAVLDESRQFIQRIIDATPVLIYIYDFQQEKNIYVNSQCMDFFGYTPVEMVGLGAALLPDLCHSDDLSRIAAHHQQLLESADDEILELEYRIRRRDGQVRWLHSWDVVFARNAAGVVTQIAGSALDITEQLETKRALVESENQYRTLFDNIPLGIGISTFEGHSLAFNAAWRDILGYDWPAIQATDLQTLYRDPGDRQFLLERIRQGESVRGMRTLLVRRDGTPFYASLTVTPFVVRGEQVLLSIVDDITEQVRAEMTLQEREATLHSILQATPIGIGMAQDRIFQWGNAWLAELLGRPEDDLVGFSAHNLYLTEMEYKRVGREFYGDLLRHKVAIIESQWVNLQGEIIDVRLYSALLDPEEPEAGIILTVQDITEEQRSQERLNRLLRQQIAVSQLALALGEVHDLNTVYQTVYRHISSLIDAWIFIVSSYDAETRLLRAEYIISDNRPQDVSILPPIALHPPGAGTQSEVIHTGKPLYIPDFQARVKPEQKVYYFEEDGSRVLEPPITEEEEEITRAVLYVPMKVEGQIIGVMQAQSPLVDAYTADDMTLLTGLANVAAVAVRNTLLATAVQRELAERRRAESELRQYTERLQNLRAIDQAILEVRSPVQIAQAAVDRLHKLIPCMVICVCLFDLETQSETLLALRSQVALPLRLGMRFELRDSILFEVFRQQQLHRIDDLGAFPQRSSLMDVFLQAGVHTYVRFPMLAKGELIGILALGCVSDSPVFDAVCIEISHEVAGQLSVALNQSRLYEQIQHHAEELEVRVAERTAQLEAVNTELKDFAYIVSHDLKAPLRGISQLADWLSLDYADKLDAEGQDMLLLMIQRVQRMHNLIEGVLAYSRVGRGVVELRPVDLNQIVAETLDLLGPHLHIQVSLVGPLPTVIGDPTRWQQVFQNLISNALKFMDKPEGHIVVGCAVQASQWLFRVTDNGPGIPEKDYARVFKIFQTVHSKEDIDSTGVGLAVVKKIVEAWGGRIWVESTVGQGSTFFFTYPKHNNQ